MKRTIRRATFLPYVRVSSLLSRKYTHLGACSVFSARLSSSQHTIFLTKKVKSSSTLQRDYQPYFPLGKKLLRRYSTVKPTIDPNTQVVLSDDVAEWSVDQVLGWASKLKNILQEDLDLLRKNRVDGLTLMTLTKEELIQLMKLYGMPGGPAATLSSAIDKVKEKKDITTVCESLKKTINPKPEQKTSHWVSRPELMDPILLWWGYNRDALVTRSRAVQENLFTSLLLSGGSGTGKTETGRQIPSLLIKKLGQTLGFGERIVKYVQTFSLVTDLQFNPKINNDDKQATHETPARDQQDVAAADHAVAVSIAASAFLQNGDKNTQIAISNSCPQLRLTDVVSAIRKSKKMSPSDILVIFVHIDEFQHHLLGTLSTLRAIGGFLGSQSYATNTLIATIMSGTRPSYFSMAGIGATDYKPSTINVPPVKQNQYIKILESFLARIQTDIKVEDLKKSEYFPFLLETTGGIPELIRLLSTVLVTEKNLNLNSIPDLSILFEKVVNLTRSRYQAANWEEILQEKKYVMKFLKHEHFGEYVTKNTRLNGRTVGEIESSGVIFLEANPDGHMQLKVPLLIKKVLVEAFHLLFYGAELLNPFSAADDRSEDFFPRQVMQIHRISAALLTPDETPAKVSLNKFYRNSLKGNPKVLEKEVEVKPNPKIRTVQEPWITHLPGGPMIACKNNEIINWEEGNYYVHFPKRAPGNIDTLTPVSREQYKYAVGFGESLKSFPYNEFEKEVMKSVSRYWTRLPLVIITPKQLTDDFWSKLNNRRKCAFVAGTDCVGKLFKDFVLIMPNETKSDHEDTIETEIIEEVENEENEEIEIGDVPK